METNVVDARERAELNRLAEVLFQTPAGQVKTEEMRRETRARRRELAAELARLEADTVAIRRARKEHEAAEVEVQRVERQLADAMARRNQAMGAAAVLADSRERAVDRTRAELRDTADPRLRALIRAIAQHHDHTRDRGVAYWRERGDPWQGKGETYIEHSNAEALQGTLATIREARRKAEALLLVDISDEDLERQLEELADQARLPSAVGPAPEPWYRRALVALLGTRGEVSR